MIHYLIPKANINNGPTHWYIAPAPFRAVFKLSP